jgi:ATP-binding cassette subfamily F protein uup
VLVLDEPTNDLDIDTLELLEELLQDYDGTVFLVSHDRTFLDNVVTSTIAFEGEGRWREYEGGVEDWLTQSRRAREYAAASASGSTAPANPMREKAPPAVAPAAPRRKLGYKDQRELEALPARIEALEQEQKAIQGELATGALYRDDPARAGQLAQRSEQIEQDLMLALERWEALGQL